MLTEGQMRSSGEPYILIPFGPHPGDMRLGITTPMAAVLHDVIEDTLSPRTIF